MGDARTDIQKGGGLKMAISRYWGGQDKNRRWRNPTLDSGKVKPNGVFLTKSTRKRTDGWKILEPYVH